jgi:hypothetical protein
MVFFLLWIFRFTATWVRTPVGSQNSKRQSGATAEARFKQRRSICSDDAGLRAEAVRLCWPLVRAVGPQVAHSAHLYLEHRECGHHCDNSHTREEVVADVAHSAG